MFVHYHDGRVVLYGSAQCRTPKYTTAGVRRYVMCVQCNMTASNMSPQDPTTTTNHSTPADIKWPNVHSGKHLQSPPYLCQHLKSIAKTFFHKYIDSTTSCVVLYNGEMALFVYLRALHSTDLLFCAHWKFVTKYWIPTRHSLSL